MLRGVETLLPRDASEAQRYVLSPTSVARTPRRREVEHSFTGAVTISIDNKYIQ